MTEPTEAVKAKAREILNAANNEYMGWEQNSWTDSDKYVVHAFATFIQQVSDAAKAARMAIAASERDVAVELLAPFILPEPVDPLQEALRDCDPDDPIYASAFREALAKRGLKIVEASHDG